MCTSEGKNDLVIFDWYYEYVSRFSLVQGRIERILKVTSFGTIASSMAGRRLPRCALSRTKRKCYLTEAKRGEDPVGSLARLEGTRAG